ncbi:hypothetical protein BV20DRAFT_952465 [Pilatotrama ljubarskyi]|nr:hypothetical protein BV20DRAFT_952465 [Pilatotrama ljubarskyi]
MVSLKELHQMMGHVSYDVVRAAVTKGLVEDVVLEPGSAPAVCDACERVKMTHKPIAHKHMRLHATEIGGELHSDLCRPAPVQTLGGQRYNTMFMDDVSCWEIVHLLCSKDETFEACQKVRLGS